MKNSFERSPQVLISTCLAIACLSACSNADRGRIGTRVSEEKLRVGYKVQQELKEVQKDLKQAQQKIKQEFSKPKQLPKEQTGRWQ